MQRSVHADADCDGDGDGDALELIDDDSPVPSTQVPGQLDVSFTPSMHVSTQPSLQPSPQISRHPSSHHSWQVSRHRSAGFGQLTVGVSDDVAGRDDGWWDGDGDALELIDDDSPVPSMQVS